MITLREDLMAAMRAKDTKKVNALRLITAAIKQVEVDERITVDDTRFIIILDKLAKQRQESITQFSAAARNDLVATEQFELDIIQHYMPTPLSDAEIDSLIEEAFVTIQPTGMIDMGKIIALLKPQMQGRVDMAKVSLQVKVRLGAC